MSAARHITTLLLAGLLVLQSVLAVAAPCDMSASDSVPMTMAMGGSDHSGHHMPAIDTAPGTDAANCCGDGYCSKNGCLSINLMTDTSSGSQPLPAGFSFSTLKIALLDPLPDSLLRPPPA